MAWCLSCLILPATLYLGKAFFLSPLLLRIVVLRMAYYVSRIVVLNIKC